MTKSIEYYLPPPNCTSPKSPITYQISIEEQDEIDNDSDTNYRFEFVRLESYKGWPSPWMKPEILAAAGFYYTGETDKVKCFECLQTLCEWQPEDRPIVEHQRWAGRCRFVRQIPCGNVPIGSDPSTIPDPTSKGVDVCGPYSLMYMPYSGPDHEDREIEERVNWLKELTSKMKHSEYASYAARLASFNRWPKAMSQTKEELANAGFFYEGRGDQTLCYYCGGGLRDWEPNDDPWVEHAKGFEYCPYLILTKGMDFVSSITGRTYIGESTPSAINKLDELFEKADSDSIASGSSQNSQNSICSEEINFNNADTSAVSGEKQSVQTLGDKSCDKDARLCKICYDREVRIVFLPCGHLLACAECAKNMKICGVCGKNIECTVRAYIP